MGDIEELVGKGREMNACPYYASRTAIPTAQLVTLPYNLLLHKDMRESLGISLQGNVVIIDEAHNLLESINSMYSVHLSGNCLQQAHGQLTCYHAQYAARLNASNRKNVETLLHILSQMLNFLTTQCQQVLLQKKKTEEDQKSVTTITDFTFTCGIDDINLFQLEKFIEKSEITKKVQGFARFQQTEEESENAAVIVSALSTFRSFLWALTHPEQDGRVVITVGSR